MRRACTGLVPGLYRTYCPGPIFIQCKAREARRAFYRAKPRASIPGFRAFSGLFSRASIGLLPGFLGPGRPADITNSAEHFIGSAVKNSFASKGFNIEIMRHCQLKEALVWVILDLFVNPDIEHMTPSSTDDNKMLRKFQYIASDVLEALLQSDDVLSNMNEVEEEDVGLNKRTNMKDILRTYSREGGLLSVHDNVMMSDSKARVHLLKPLHMNLLRPASIYRKATFAELFITWIMSYRIGSPLLNSNPVLKRVRNCKTKTERYEILVREQHIFGVDIVYHLIAFPRKKKFLSSWYLDCHRYTATCNNFCMYLKDMDWNPEMEACYDKETKTLFTQKRREGIIFFSVGRGVFCSNREAVCSERG